MPSHLPRYVRIYDDFFDVQENFVIELSTERMRFIAKYGRSILSEVGESFINCRSLAEECWQRTE